MAQSPPQQYAQAWSEDGREPLPLVGDERTMLTAFLDWHRQTLELKCAGVSEEQLSVCQVPPSGLTLHGLVRHLAAVERWWFRQQLAGEDVSDLYFTAEDPDADFDDLSGSFTDALEAWRDECRRSREIVAAATSLDVTGVHWASGRPIALRRILVHMIAEYARHNGHADLLRERIDGATGY
ncbi:MAG TPA: DinB family protein [Jiangellales bacterium]|nr:DinB family protein [Jiangellales bacterium]